MKVDLNPDFIEKVLAGRNAVDEYREVHRKNKTHPIDVLLKTLREVGFDKSETLGDFYYDNTLYNVQQLGYKDIPEWLEKATPIEKEALEKLWK